MKTTHKQKVNKAKKMLSNEENKKGTSIFQSKSWNLNKKARRTKELKKQK